MSIMTGQLSVTALETCIAATRAQLRGNDRFRHLLLGPAFMSAPVTGGAINYRRGTDADGDFLRRALPQ